MEEDTSQQKQQQQPQNSNQVTQTEPPQFKSSRRNLALNIDGSCLNGENKSHLSAIPGNGGEIDSLLSVDEVDALPHNLKYSIFDLFCTLISILTYVADLIMDIVVAVYFYHLGVNYGIYHYWYFGLTVTFILLPSLTMTGFSFRWYLQDADDAQLPAVPLWRWVLRLVVLMLQIAPVLRCDTVSYTHLTLPTIYSV